jgi:hypothetical protein
VCKCSVINMFATERAITRLRYSPSERYQRNGSRPFTCIFHLITLIFATLLICTHNKEVGRLKRQSAVVFSSLLYPQRRTFGTLKADRITALSADIDLVPNENLGTTSYYILSSVQLVRDINQLVEHFFALNTEYLGCANNVCNSTMSGHVTLTSYANSTAFDVDSDYRYTPLEKKFTQHKLSRKDKGLPKEMTLGKHWNSENKWVIVDSALLSYIDRLVVMDINLALITDDFSVPLGNTIFRSAYTLRIKYSSLTTGQVVVTMEPHLHVFPLSLCFSKQPKQPTPTTASSDGTTTGSTSVYAIYMSGKVIVVILSAISAVVYQLLILRNVCDFYQLWRSVSTRRDILEASSAREQQVQVKTCFSETLLVLRIFNLSLVCGTIGNICLVLYSLVYIAYEAQASTCDVSSSFQSDAYISGEDNSNILMGCAVMLLWFDMLQYFAYGEEGGNLRTLQHSAYKVGRVIVFVLPVFTGFVVFGVSAFGAQVPQFETFSSTAIVLFATLNGDECRQAYTALQEDCTDCASPLIGWIYMSSWLCFAMYVVLNIVIAIIEDVYMSYVSQVPVQKRQQAAMDSFDEAVKEIEEVVQSLYENSTCTRRRVD